MSAAATLKERLLAEIRGEDWGIPEIGRQFGCPERMVFHHFRYGLPSRIVEPSTGHQPGRSRAVFAPALVEDWVNRPPK